MDRSFLSQPAVVTASRKFVCVRLATYENPAEAAMLKGFTPTRSGELENTVFGILAPDGKEKLVRSARGARQLFADATEMATAMDRLAARFTPKAAEGTPPLPKVATVRLAVNVAAADNLPLVVVVGPDAAARKATEEKIAALAWSDEFIGKFTYAAGPADDLLAIEGVDKSSAVLVVQPEKFGRKGKVLAQCPAGGKLAETLRAGSAAFAREAKTFANHVREGQRQGVFWETALPVTDPMEKAARERGRR